MPQALGMTLEKRRLPRLNADAYRGCAFVHWSMTIEDRKDGWLDTILHARLREVLVHLCVRYRLALAAYTLMPDHAHFLILGCSTESDQRPAVRMLRRYWAELLPEGIGLQRQAYDRVLREKDRERFTFENAAEYILANPVRANLVEDWRNWPFCGGIVPGYPALDPRAREYWKSFWPAHEGFSLG